MTPTFDTSADFPRRVLVSSLGLSPQIFTETLFALLRSDPPWHPTEAIILTSPEGEALARSLLLPEDTGAIAAMARDWEWPWLNRLGVRIEVPDLADAVDPDGAHSAMIDTATRVLRDLCDDADAQVHVSLAGGRKSASAGVAIALALFGRAQDRLSHVLVADVFATNPAFFYPAPRRRTLIGTDGRLHDAASAEVRLVRLPFPRLRAFAHKAVADYDEAIRLTQRHLERRRLVVDLAGRELLWNGAPLALPPALAAFLAWLADDALREGGGLERAGTALDPYIEAYRRVAGPGAAARASARLSSPSDPEWMEEKVSRLGKLVESFGVRPRGARLIQRVGPRAEARYRLALDPEEIEWRGARLRE